MKILMVAFEAGRWGPARLPKPLSENGFEVAALCPSENALARTRYLQRHFPLPDVQASRAVARHLSRAIRAWQPRLIIPCDERTVACLHALLRRGDRSVLDQAARDLLIASMAPLDRLDATLLKTRTLELAREAGVRIPAGGAVDGAEAALTMAEQIGYPIYVKSSFSWAGQGVTLCHTSAALQAALAATQPGQRHGARAVLKRLLDRDWYPTRSPVDVQQAIDGQAAMFSTVALGGRMLAGFAGMKLQSSGAHGPSSVVRLGAHAEMEQAASRLIAAMGASGFLSFDFMIETATGRAYLIECNPRPAQVGHLGGRIGVDLCAALAQGLRGAAEPSRQAAGEAIVALFPQEWLRARETTAGFGTALDVPWDDTDLLRAIVAA